MIFGGLMLFEFIIFMLKENVVSFVLVVLMLIVNLFIVLMYVVVFMLLMLSDIVD